MTIIETDDWINHPVWSPDASKILLEYEGDTYLMNKDGSNMVKVPVGYPYSFIP